MFARLDFAISAAIAKMGDLQSIGRRSSHPVARVADMRAGGEIPRDVDAVIRSSRMSNAHPLMEDRDFFPAAVRA